MALVAGVDCATQSTKVVVCDAQTGAVARHGRAEHPDATEIHPSVWWDALQRAAAEAGGLDDVAAIAVGGQQHGMVCLDDRGRVVRPALLWNDTRSAAAAEELVAELGGPEAWAKAVGSVPLASFTITKLRWLAEAEPKLAKRVATVLLPHDWLTLQLRASASAPTTDRGDASGTGYWSPSTGEYRRDLLRLAFGRQLAVPRVAEPAEPVGFTSAGVPLAPGTGDNMAAALGLGLRAGDVAVSLGTSGTVFAVRDEPTEDPTGTIAGFADATGRHLPLVCTLNAARVLTTVAGLLGVTLSTLDEMALAASPGADGLTLLPYLDGERTPNLPDAHGLLAGLTRTNATPYNVARAAVEGMLSGLADGLDALWHQGVQIDRIILIGGAAASAAVRAIAPAVFGVPVLLPEPAEFVARGAARQAAWALAGSAEPPDWPIEAQTVDAPPADWVRRVYGRVRDRARELMQP